MTTGSSTVPQFSV